MTEPTWYVEIISNHKDDSYATLLQQEVDTLADGSVEHYWEVYTYRLDANGNIDELINNTGSIDNYPEALNNYGYHLDLYYGKTLEEVMS